MQPKSVPFGRYDLIKRVARGGMAEIFLAIERGIEGVRRQVVVKRILPHMAESDDFVTMFMDEARVVARISHPNIVHIYNFGEVDGVYFIAMEFVDGLTISRLQRLARPQPIPVEISLRVMADICAGLHAAHELTDEFGQLLGVIHRDVSPQNILVSKNGMAKLIDFGVARAATQVHATEAGQIKGKLGYIAPEQFHRKTAMDRRADVFSAGAVLYEMIVGERLFVRETEAGTLNAILNEEPPSFLDREIMPEPVDSIIRSAVHKSPGGRFATAAEMQQAIEQVLVQGGHFVSPSVVGSFVSTYLEKAKKQKGTRKARAALEHQVPSSYPSDAGGQQASSGPSWSSASPHPSWASSDPVFGDVGAGALSDSQPSQPISSIQPSGMTPKPASDMPPRTGHRSLWIAVACVGAVLLVAVGVFAGLSIRGSEGREIVATPAKAPAAGRGAKIKPTPIDPGDLLPPSSSPRSPSKEVPQEQETTTDAGAGEDADGEPETPSEPQARPATTTKSSRAKIVRPRGKGRLFLNSRPWCKVRSGGRYLGTTPLINVELPSGTHSLVLTDANGRKHRRSVRIRTDQPTKVFLKLGSNAE